MGSTLQPVDAVAGQPSYNGRRLRQTASALLFGASVGRLLGGRSGIRPGPTAGLLTATSTTWTLAAHAGIADAELANEAGPYRYAFDTAQTGAMTPAPSSPNSRIDIVWVRIDDPSESDGSTTPQPVAGYTAGQAASSPAVPSPPAISGDSSGRRYIVIGQILVPASGAPVVTITAPFTAAAGGRLPVWSQAERDALPVYNGLCVHRLDTGNVESYHNGWRTELDVTAYTAYTATMSGEGGGSTTTPGGSGGQILARYKVLPGKTMRIDFTIFVGASGMGTSLTGIYNISLPLGMTGALQLGVGVDPVVGTVTYYGGGQLTGNVVVRSNNANRLALDFNGMAGLAQAGNPASWGAGVRVTGSCLLELA